MNRFESVTVTKPLMWLMALLLAAFVAGCGGGNESPADTTAPTVTLTAPANAATSIAINTNIAATFSEKMKASTITDLTFTLTDGVTAVSGVASYAGKTATFNPDSDLTASTTYTATVSTGVKDKAGNALAADKIWTFTTGAAADNAPPTVNSTDPADTDTGVAKNANINAAFNEIMDPSTISTTTFTLKKGATPVLGAVSYLGTTATFNPTNNLASSTTYTATVSTGAKDLAGNALASDFTWSFQTGSTLAVGATPPTLGETGRFVIIASQTITTTSGTAISNGDMGILDMARTYYAGFTPGVNPGQYDELTNGLSYAHSDTDLALIPAPYASTIAFIDQVRTDLGNAYAFLAADPNPGVATQVCPTELGLLTLTPGVYKTADNVGITTGTLHLDALGDPNAVWIFSIEGTLTTGAPGGSIDFVGGIGQAKNVYWRTGGATYIGTYTTFIGNVFAWSQVQALTGANITGRLFALTDQVTLDANIVTKAP